jgi:hypothetical protein
MQQLAESYSGIVGMERHHGIQQMFLEGSNGREGEPFRNPREFMGEMV